MSPQRVQSLRSSVKNQRPTAGTREPGEAFFNFPDLQFGVINASKAAVDLIAVRFFSAATNYAEGDFVIQAGRGYRAKGPIVSGAFNAADWDTLTISGEFEPPIAAGTTADYWRGDKSWQTLNKAAVGLSNVDNTSDANKPVSSAQQTALNLKANLASPTFSGDPRAPTPAYPDNDTSIATTAFVSANFAPIMDPFLGGNPQATTPPTSDNDTSIATTAYVQANLVNYAPIASPTFTGDPKAPTPSQGDNDTSIATTAFVTTAVANKIADAPNDTNAYGRKANAWVDVTEEAPADGVSYGRKNGNWVASVGGAVVSDTPPPGPLIVGQLWYEADSGNTYLWYSDADSSQWVQVNVQPAPAATPAVVGTAQARNRIVNGAMQISQENIKNFGIPITSGGNNFPADQWQTSHVSAASAFTTACVDSVANPDAIWRIRMNVGATADAAIAAGDYARFYQSIEGIRVADFAWGTVSAKQVVLRFTARSTVAGTFCVALRNGAALNRSYVKNCVLAAANTDQEFTLVIPGDTTGTWATDTTHGMTLIVSTAAGTTFQGVEGWQAGNIMATSAISNFLATANATFDITKVGLYLDPANTGKAPDWVMPDEAEELRACQRYYEVINGANTLIWSGSATNAGAYFNSTQFKVPKRVTPSVVATGGSASGFPTTPGALTVSDEAVREQRTANATTVAAYFYTSTFNISARM